MLDNKVVSKQEAGTEYFVRLNKHRQEVLYYLGNLAIETFRRAANHDISKSEKTEKALFNQTTTSDTIYGSPEYFERLKSIEKGIKLHYKRNRHHPEHFENGIKDMNLIDILEMLIDWYSASRCYSETGDIGRSIEINQERFNYSNELKQILYNTIDYLEEI